MKRRAFDQLCGVSAALDVVGDRWALLVVRELLFSRKRFGDLQRGLPGIGTNTLTMRLVELEEAGILEKRTTPPPLSVTAYELTERGRALTPTILALVRWGSAELSPAKPKHRLQPAWLGVALLAYFEPSAAPDRPLEIALVFPKGTLGITLGRQGLRIVEGEGGAAAITLTASNPEVVLSLLRRLLSVPEAIKSRDLRVSGGAALVAPFLASFSLGNVSSK